MLPTGNERVSLHAEIEIDDASARIYITYVLFNITYDKKHVYYASEIKCFREIARAAAIIDDGTKLDKRFQSQDEKGQGKASQSQKVQAQDQEGLPETFRSMWHLEEQNVQVPRSRLPSLES